MGLIDNKFTKAASALLLCLSMGYAPHALCETQTAPTPAKPQAQSAAKPGAQTAPAAKPQAPAQPQAKPAAAPAQAAPAPSIPFDHSRTGFVLRDVHTTLRCEQCHVDGIFKNTPRDCAGCHSIGSRVGATPKPVNHVPTTAPCDTCHNSPTSFLVRSFKHLGISSGCITCHNGQSLGVMTKPANHFPTLQPCESCHTNTNTFASWRMDHTGIVSGCANCHSGQFPGVTAKPAMHIPTTAGCETCHASTVTFLGAKYDHSTAVPAVAGRCTDCHAGTYPGVVAKPATHLMTTAQCDTCHTQLTTQNYTTFLGAVVDHTLFTPAVAGRCSDCHNGVSALGKPAWHMVTTAQCDTCHTQTNTNNYTTFLGAGFNHTASAAGTCQTCHNGTQAKGMIAGHIPTGALSCDGCHKMYNGTTVTSFAGAAMNHLVTTAFRCDTCHNGSYTTQGLSGAQPKVSNHIPTTITGALDCNTCHTITLSSSIATMSWLSPEKMNHNNAQGMGAGGVYCVNCHLTGVTYMGAMIKKSHNGASTAKDCSSSSCHKPLGRIGTSYTSWN